MPVQFYELTNVVEVPTPGALAVARANAILGAIESHQDFKVVQLFESAEAAKFKFSCIVVDVECHGVPSKNEFGIKFRERLALYVIEDEKALIEVSALRKNFPRLLHQNQSLHGSPASLCLYYEPPASVLRTWTAQTFLRRIQWWLVNSAKGELHPADQSVEQLFFVTKYELVLPWFFDTMKEPLKNGFSIHCAPKRTDGGQTYFLNVVPVSGVIPLNGIQPIEFTLPAILHGQVESDPTTLGELSAQLSARGVDLIAALRSTVQEKVDQNGSIAASDSPFVVILLHVPVTRAEGAAPERTSRRAFFLDIGRFKLGASIGALMLHEGKYFKDVMGKFDASATAPWQQLTVFAMEVLRKNDAKMSRQQSGLSDAGPAAVIVGAGAIGSALLNIWGRSGWGQWTVIEKDHIKPHNIVRHTADTRHIGLLKAEVVRQLNQDITDAASEIVPICADACDLTNEQVKQSLCASKLVVDASAALEYPRLASTVDELARHMSVFLTPSGNAAVLLAEDEDRRLKLRTLEAQYYRALIHESWGHDHLDGNLGTFWSGASCRDISMALPYSRVLGHVGNLAEQIQRAASSSEPLIRIWAREEESGAVVAHTVQLFPENSHSFGKLQLYIDDGVIQRLRELRNAHAPRETGGVLIGYYDLNIDAIVIVDGLAAPDDSISTEISFERGVAGLTDAIAEISRRTSGIVRYVGEWHSHPPGHSSNPSGDDMIQLAYLALGMAEDGLPAVSLIVGEQDIRVLQGSIMPTLR